jgi:myo-inositol 2-dehydrogenase/D-chiro-inositol 1-dehydrogenase
MNFSRRDFIKTAGVATLGSMMPLGNDVMAAKSAAWSSNSNTLKVGLIGCGGRGSGAAEQALNADSNVVLAAMADAFKDQLDNSYKKLKDKYPQKVQVSDNMKFVGLDAYQKLLDSDIDVVILATPPGFRPTHLEYAVNAGKHIFCEKPFAVDGPGLRKVIMVAQKAKEKNISLMSGFCWRYHLPKRETFKRVLNGQIGNILTVEATYNTGELWSKERQSGWTDMEYKLRNWLYYNWLSGDHIIEQAIHSLDMMQWGMGDALPARVTASGGRLKRTDKKFGNVYDHFSAIYEYPNGAKAYFCCRQQNGTSPSYGVEFVGNEGKCVIDCRTGLHEITGANPWRYDDTTKFTDADAYKKEKVKDMYQEEHDELFAAIRNNTLINDGEWMTRSNLVALAGRMSAYSGQTISLEQALCSTETFFPEPFTFNTDYDKPVAIPGITTFK